MVVFTRLTLSLSTRISALQLFGEFYKFDDSHTWLWYTFNPNNLIVRNFCNFLYIVKLLMLRNCPVPYLMCITLPDPDKTKQSIINSRSRQQYPLDLEYCNKFPFVCAWWQLTLKDWSLFQTKQCLWPFSKASLWSSIRLTSDSDPRWSMTPFPP